MKILWSTILTRFVSCFIRCWDLWKAWGQRWLWWRHGFSSQIASSCQTQEETRRWLKMVDLLKVRWEIYLRQRPQIQVSVNLWPRRPSSACAHALSSPSLFIYIIPSDQSQKSPNQLSLWGFSPMPLSAAWTLRLSLLIQPKLPPPGLPIATINRGVPAVKLEAMETPVGGHPWDIRRKEIYNQTHLPPGTFALWKTPHTRLARSRMAHKSSRVTWWVEMGCQSRTQEIIELDGAIFGVVRCYILFYAVV